MRVKISTGFCIISAIMLLVIPLPWLTAILLSSLVHELFHYFALKLSGISIFSWRLTAGGVYLDIGDLLPLQEAFCALAGPLGALILLAGSRWIPRTAICAAVQSAYHLLPLFPLDGGRAVRSLFYYLGFPQIASRVLEWITILLLLLTGLLFLRSAVRIWIAVGAVVIIFRVFREKFLAKKDGTGYNSSTKQCEVRL